MEPDFYSKVALLLDKYGSNPSPKKARNRNGKGSIDALVGATVTKLSFGLEVQKSRKKRTSVKTGITSVFDDMAPAECNTLKEVTDMIKK